MEDNNSIKSAFVVSPHANQANAEETDTGMLNMGNGMPGPAQAAHTLVIQPGKTARRLYELRGEIQGRPVQPGMPATVPAPAVKKGGKRRKAAAPEDVPKVQAAVNVSVAVEGLGAVPSQYRHVYFGEDTIVLGLNELSYVPAVATAQVALSVRPEHLYVNSGYSFVDADGVRNIIMIKVPDDDGQAI